MSVEDELILVGDGPIATITFNRPAKANAIRLDWPGRIIRFLREVDRNAEVRCVLLRANGRHFQAGGDLETLDVSETTPLHQHLGTLADGIAEWNQMVRLIYSLTKPVVASVQGGVVGGTIGMVAACDLVIAADDCFFLLAQPRNGFTLDGMPSYFLPRQIGQKKAMEWALLGRRCLAEEAARLGVVNFVVARAELGRETDALMNELASAPTTALGLNKALINRSFDHDFDSQGGREMDTYMHGAATADWREGTNSFIEKRAPRFIGR